MSIVFSITYGICCFVSLIVRPSGVIFLLRDADLYSAYLPSQRVRLSVTRWYYIYIYIHLYSPSNGSNTHTHTIRKHKIIKQG